MMKQTIQKEMEHFLAEDGFSHNFFYYHSLPLKNVHCCLKFKDHLTIAGLPYFAGVFQYLSGPSPFELNLDGEGKTIRKEDQFELSFHLPFALALTGERTALNLLQKACAVATYTTQCVEKARPLGIEILDTRKTTPGLRQLEKYAVRVGGGKNHRMHQTDVWMIKDNHKSFFGGLKKALDFFHSLGAFYHSLVVEVHDLSELVEAMELGAHCIMLDHFSPGQIKTAIDLKQDHVTYEVSGGVTLENMDQFLIRGVDALSMGSLTQGVPSVDISLKYH